MKPRASNKRLRADVLREKRFPGVNWLERPVPLVPGSTCIVHGVTRDSPKGQLHWWQRESRRRGVDREPERRVA
jgi:hypothetical protein